MTTKLYLDYAATSPLGQEAKEAMVAAMDLAGNPSSLHSFGREAGKLLRDSRNQLAQLLKTTPSRLIFTSGGTESNNMAIKGYALANQEKGKHLISSQLEHHAVLDVLAYLEDRFGFEVTLLPPSEDGTITAHQVAKALRPDTILVSLMWVNNETGHINPIAEIADLLKDHQAVFHVDAVQALGKLPVFPDDLGVDFLSASAHKFHGPKGVGFLYARDHQLDRLLHGGNQESHRRASTENLIGIAGMVAALAATQAQVKPQDQTAQTLKQALIEQLADSPVYFNSPLDGLPQVINLGIPGSNNALLLTRLDLEGIAVSTGSACTAGNVEPSHVLAALFGPDAPQLTESIRVSTSSQTSLADISHFTQTLKRIIG